MSSFYKKPNEWIVSGFLLYLPEGQMLLLFSYNEEEGYIDMYA